MLDLQSGSSSTRLSLEELRKEAMESQAQVTQVVELRKAGVSHVSTMFHSIRIYMLDIYIYVCMYVMYFYFDTCIYTI